MSEWTAVCRISDLVPERGAAALVGERQVALFRLGDDEVLAVGHRDPFSGANVMARGLVGTRGTTTTLTSPLHKQVFDLRTGHAVDYPDVTLEPWEVRTLNGEVQIRPRSPEDLRT